MDTRYILLGLGSCFLLAGLASLPGNQWRVSPAARTWLLIGGFFLAVGMWLLYSVQ
jgi:hypothetical protein